jgi:hypothetical protein
MLGTWTWYANWSTGLSASSPLVCTRPHSSAPKPHRCPEPVAGLCLTLLHRQERASTDRGEAGPARTPMSAHRVTPHS